MSESTISAEKADQHSKSAGERRATDVAVKHPIERFNQGLPPLTESGEKSPGSIDVPIANAADFIPSETNAAGVAKRKELLSRRIDETTDEEERKKIERVRDSLEVETLVAPPSRTNEKGDFVRTIPETQSLADPETGQEFRFVLYNWDKRRPGEPVTVSLPSYNTPVDKNSTAAVRDFELASQMPDKPMIAMMHPGMGSDKLTKKQISELSTDKAYFSIAEAQLRVLKELGVGPEDSIDLVGESMGAFAALAIAARAESQGVKVNKMVLAALLGVEKTSPFALGRALGEEGKYLPTALSGPFDPSMYEAGFLDKSNLGRNWEFVKYGVRMLKNDPITHGLPYVRAMAKETATDRLLDVLNGQPESSVTLIAGKEDKVSKITGVHKTVDTLREHGYGSDRAGLILFPGAAHVVMENALRYAGTVKHALEGKPVAA